MTKPNLLSQKAILAGLSIGGWSARKLDKKVTKETNEQRKASADAGRYNKLLVAKGSPLDDANRLASAARAWHYSQTLPWLDEGARILPSALYAEYATETRKRRAEYMAAVDVVVKEYPAMKAAAKVRLNGMFNEEDYPPVADVKNRFKFDIRMLPCPDAADFRVDIAAEHADDIRSEIEDRMKSALEIAMKEPVKRIMDVVGVIVNRLSSYQPATEEYQATRLYDSMVENVRELAELLPAFNLTGDKALTKITERIKKDLCAHSIDDLKESEDVRKKVQRAAESIIAQAEQFMA